MAAILEKIQKHLDGRKIKAMSMVDRWVTPANIATWIGMGCAVVAMCLVAWLGHLALGLVLAFVMISIQSDAFDGSLAEMFGRTRIGEISDLWRDRICKACWLIILLLITPREFHWLILIAAIAEGGILALHFVEHEFRDDLEEHFVAKVRMIVFHACTFLILAGTWFFAEFHSVYVLPLLLMMAASIFALVALIRNGD